MRVHDIVSVVASAFPPELADSWDRPGLSVGDPDAQVTGVACALDVTPTAIRAARDAGCNVLVTHHPAFLDPPFPVTPEVRTSSLAGACDWEAVRLGVALVAAHTNLDRSEAALDLASELLGLERTGRLQEPKGYGALLEADGLTLGQLASRAGAAFGCTPTVWGDPARALETAAFCSGSLGSFGQDAVRRGVGCVITGEAGYHWLSELACAGVDAILLGHDASERPYAGLLARTLRDAAPDTGIQVLDEPLRWRAWPEGE